MGHDSVNYVDYSYLKGNTCMLWPYNVMATIQTLRALSLLYAQIIQLSSQSKLLRA